MNKTEPNRRKRFALLSTILTLVVIATTSVAVVAQRRRASRPAVRQPSQSSSREKNEAVVEEPTSDEIWVNIFGADAYELYRDVRDVNTVYAETFRGLYRTTNAGLLWTPFFTPRDYGDARLFIAGKNFKGLGPGGVSFAQSLSSPNVMYVFGRSIDKSDDGGAHWFDARGGVIRGGISNLKIDPNDANHVCADSYVTTNGGRSWALRDQTSSCQFQGNLTPPAHQDMTSYRVDSSGVWKSTDEKSSWHKAGFGLPTLRIAQSNIWYIPDDLFIRLASVDESGRIYVADKGGYWTDDSGFNWKWHPLNKDRRVRQVVALKDGAYITLDDGTVLRVDLEGTVQAQTKSLGDTIAVSLADARIIYTKPNESNDVYTRPNDSHDVLKSDDSGKSWRKVHDGGRETVVIRVSPKTPGIVYVLTQGGNGYLYVSIDGGESWLDARDSFERAARRDPNVLETGDDGLFEAVSIAPDPKDPNVVYIATDQRIYRSADAGRSWVPITNKHQLGKISGIAISSPSSRAIYVTSDLGVWRSTTSGRSWRLLNIGFNGDQILSLIPSDSIVLAQGFYGIYRLSDKQLSWASETWKRLETKSNVATSIATGEWVGEWSDSAGNMFTFEMRISGNATDIAGSIRWTIKKSSRSDLQRKLGFTAVEYVKGTFDPQSRSLNFEGYYEDDPERIIGLDKYRLVLSMDGSILMGQTEANGNWDGRFEATRKQ